jgi:hypothetical protein
MIEETDFDKHFQGKQYFTSCYLLAENEVEKHYSHVIFGILLYRVINSVSRRKDTSFAFYLESNPSASL